MTPEFKYQISDSDLTLTPAAKQQFTEILKDVEDWILNVNPDATKEEVIAYIQDM